MWMEIQSELGDCMQMVIAQPNGFLLAEAGWKGSHI